MRMSSVLSVAANATSPNLLAGKLGEFLEGPSIVTISGSAAVVGMNISASIGRRVIVDDEEISSAARFPILPDDLIAQAPGAGMERIIVRTRNTSGAAIIGNVAVDVTPI